MRFAATPFPETLRSLQSDRPTRVLLGIAVTLIVSSLWLAWLVKARVPVFVTTSTAQLRASNPPIQVVADVEGRVQSISAQLGAEVETAEVLMVLDTKSERLRLKEISSAREAAKLESEALEKELEFRRLELERSHQEVHHKVQQAILEAENARLAAGMASADFARNSVLAEQGVLSRSQSLHDETLARQLAAVLQARQETVEATQKGGERIAEGLRANISGLERQLAETNGEVEGFQARYAILDDEIDRHTLRAASSGRLAEIRDLSEGSLVRHGDQVATILPKEGLVAVGWFPVSEALARIRPGQAAQLRLDGFPWAEYGALDTTVQRVAGEERDGLIRVECRLEDSAKDSRVPLEHGIRGSLVIEIEKASPFSLLLRSVGKRVLRDP